MGSINNSHINNYMNLTLFHHAFLNLYTTIFTPLEHYQHTNLFYVVPLQLNCQLERIEAKLIFLMTKKMDKGKENNGGIKL